MGLPALQIDKAGPNGLPLIGEAPQRFLTALYDWLAPAKESL